VLAEITSMSVKSDNLAVKAVLLGSMPSTLYLRPEELWRLLRRSPAR
jgi:hypothetical protein